MTVVLIAVAGMAGVLTRYGIGRAVPIGALPWATVAINIAGSALLGFLVASGDRLSPEVRTSLAIGFLGGFTTFSTFSVDAFLDIESGRGGEALLYVSLSVIGGIVAAAGGYYAGRALTR